MGKLGSIVVYLANDGQNRYIIKKIPRKYETYEHEIVSYFKDDPNFVNLITTFENEAEDAYSLVFEHVKETFATIRSIDSR